MSAAAPPDKVGDEDDANDTRIAGNEDKVRVTQVIEADPYESMIPATFGAFVWEILGGANTLEIVSPDQQQQPQQEMLSAAIQQFHSEKEQQQPDGSKQELRRTDSQSGGGGGGLLHQVLSTLGFEDADPSLQSAHGSKDSVTLQTAAEAEVVWSAEQEDQLTLEMRGRDDAECTRPVLTLEMAQALQLQLPTRYKECQRWQLTYSLEQHGASLTTLYRQCREFADGEYPSSSRCPSVLCIRDDGGARFGAFVTEVWHPNSGSGTAAHAQLSTSPQSPSVGSFGARGRSYYGTGECFLWQWQGHLTTHAWTFKNDYFMLSEADFLAVGGGDGGFGVYVDKELYRGKSTACATFANTEPLCTDRQTGEFKCVALEIWGLC